MCFFTAGFWRKLKSKTKNSSKIYQKAQKVKSAYVVSIPFPHQTICQLEFMVVSVFHHEKCYKAKGGRRPTEKFLHYSAWFFRWSIVEITWILQNNQRTLITKTFWKIGFYSQNYIEKVKCIFSSKCFLKNERLFNLSQTAPLCNFTF